MAPTVVLHPARMIRTDTGQARHLAANIGGAELVLLASADLLFWLADGDAVLAAVDRLLLRRTSTPGGLPPTRRLHALVAVRPAGAVCSWLAAHGAEVSHTVDDVAVGIFASLAAAEAAADRCRVSHPAANIIVEVADTSGDPDDPAVADLVRRSNPSA